MSVASTRQEFVERVRTALGEEVSDPPSSDQILRYFRSLSNSPQDAIDAYKGYASLYYIHIDSSSHPGATVTYPGGTGRDCDSWAEVVARPMENGRHIIDCRGFVVMGVTLLREAGFQFSRYMVAVPPSALQEGWQGHVFAEMTSASGQAIYVGNDDIHYSAAGAVEGLAGWSPDDEVNVRYGSGDTIQEAVEEADQIVRGRIAHPLSDVNVVAPLIGRRSISPPTFER
jgi:hypothetical protein